MDAQAGRVQALTRAEDGPQIVERLRAGVYAAVMESCGLYFARDKAQASAFAVNLRGHLTQVASDWRKLHDVLPVSEQTRSSALDGAMTSFVTLRTELARVGVEEGTQAADKFGNNDSNRLAREAFSHGLDELATVTTKAVDDLEAETIAVVSLDTDGRDHGSRGGHASSDTMANAPFGFGATTALGHRAWRNGGGSL